jgi:hypothetical protein
MFFPIFISQKKYKNVPNIAQVKPLIEIYNGEYKEFNKKLELNGSFEKAFIFKDNYQIYNLIANNLDKNEKYIAKYALKKDGFIKAKDVIYSNSDYSLFSKNMIYDEKKKFLKGFIFNFKSKEAKGRGNYFEIDKNKNLFAKNIIYQIKVDK